MAGQDIFPNAILKYLLISFLVVALLYSGKMLFIPMCYGLFIAIILYPVCKWLEHHRITKSIAIAISLTIIVILFAALVWLMFIQFNAFRGDLPELKAKAGPFLAELQNWIAEHFSIPVASQNEWWKTTSEGISGNPGSLLTGLFRKITNSLFMLFLIPVFAALFLYNRKDFVVFLEKTAGNKYDNKLQKILQQVIHTYFRFVRGMIMVYIIVGTLNSIGLLALGIRHAILFGFLAAIMTIIPYIGIFLSALLPISVAWITKDSIWYPIGVAAVFGFVQYLEANVIFPRVVAFQLNVSTWATLVAVVAGGILWGVNGMILFIPFVAILKIITDFIPEWEALNVLLRRSERTGS